MLKYLLILSSFLFVINYCDAQINIDSIYVSGSLPYCLKNGEEIVLTNHSSWTRFILDSARIHITAINSKGVQLWYSNPYSYGPAQTGPFKIDKPIIVAFNFVKDDLTKNKIAIYLMYSDKSGGYVDLENGHYTWQGQD